VEERVRRTKHKKRSYSICCVWLFSWRSICLYV